jgi:hypothetical protein
MKLDLTTGNYGRTRVGLPTTRLVNAYIESSPGGPSGTGPIIAIYQQPGLFNGDLFTISGSTLYRNNTALGTVAYSQAPQIVAADDLMAIVSGGGLYIYDGTTFSQQVYFDDGTSLLPTFSGVCVLDSIFIYPVENSDQFFFSAVGDPSSINAANFSAAQTAPDNIVQSYVLADQLVFFGQTSIEFWYFTGQLTAPFAIQLGTTMKRGCASQGSVRALDNALFWVGDDLVVYRTTQVPERVSTSFIEGRIHLEAKNGNISNITSLIYQIEGHVVYILNLPKTNESWAYDCQTSEWFQIGTQQLNQFNPGVFQGAVGAGEGTTQFVGSYNDGRVFLWDIDNHTDDGVPIQVVVSGAAWIEEGIHRNNNVSLHMVRGIATSETPLPTISMRWSDDGGRTFSSWRPGSVGTIGDYRYKTTWRALGFVRQPGRLFEFLLSDPVNFTVEGATVNAARV